MTKFGKAWKRRFDALPPLLQSHSIHYKRWKRHTDHVTAVPQLARDVAVVERMSTLWTKQQSRRLDRGWPTRADVLEFVDLNATATRKICKRLSKRLHIPASAWLAENGGRFSFCSAAHRAKLRVVAEGAGECPVCLDDLATKKTAVITACGHVFCAECTLRLAGVERARGTLYNVLSWARWYRPRFACPTCRMRDPTREMIFHDLTSSSSSSSRAAERLLCGGQ